MMIKASILPLLLLLFTGCIRAQQVYEYRGGDPDGISKWYMGRQIAQVMSHYGIGWLERTEREEEEKCSQVLENMQLQPGMVVADIGAGSGYYSVRMAKLVGSGKILAVDVAPEMIAYIKKRVRKAGITNVETVLGSEDSTGIAPGTADVLLLVDVYHELSFPKEMGASMLQALKPGGLLYLVEYRAEDPEVPIKAVHKMTEEQAVKELETAGFKFVKNYTNLPWQHCMVFQKPGR